MVTTEIMARTTVSSVLLMRILSISILGGLSSLCAILEVDT